MMGAVGSGLPWQAGVFLRPALGRNGMRAALILLIGFAGAAWAASGNAQTTAGTSATIVVPVVAQTSSFTSEVTVYNPNAGAITLSVAFYNAQNTTSPGAKTCNALLVPGGRSAAFTVTTQCALPTPPNFGLLILAEQTGTQRFHGYVRTQTPQGVGFSTEGFPIENFNDQLQHATGLKRAAASGSLPAYQTNCFVASLGDAVSYEMRLFDGATGAQLGGTLSGSLQPYQSYRYLDVFAEAGVAPGNRSNVRAQFANLTASQKKLIGFCTVQENTTFSADFRIAKSYGGTPQNAFVQGGNAFGTTATIGTTDNQPLNLNVNGQRVARYEPNANGPNVIFGHSSNGATAASAGQTIGGGGEAGDTCFDSSSGLSNRPCANRTTDAFATVAGGYANVAMGFAAAVGGGEGNTSGVEAVVGGGAGNSATGRWTTVAGGASNVASGEFATVTGGHSNTASLDYASVGGGESNTASGGRATVAGGTSNLASNSAATVGGGIFNTASGGGATVPGGSGNTASGQYSFAAGHRAKATTTGTFMWADSREFDFQPSVNNFFGARATGGVGFTVAINSTNGAVTQFCNLLPGVASWQCTSDRNAKENFAAVDSKRVLEQLVAMPLSTWNFKGADPQLRLLGPTAQDFHAAFGLGNDDKTIVGTNLHGVALAAVQGLHAIVRGNEAQMRALLADKDEQIRMQQSELAALRDRLSELEQLRVEMSSIQATLRTLRDAPLRQPANDVHAAAP